MSDEVVMEQREEPFGSRGTSTKSRTATRPGAKSTRLPSHAPRGVSHTSADTQSAPGVQLASQSLHVESKVSVVLDNLSLVPQETSDTLPLPQRRSAGLLPSSGSPEHTCALGPITSQRRFASCLNAAEVGEIRSSAPQTCSSMSRRCLGTDGWRLVW